MAIKKALEQIAHEGDADPARVAELERLFAEIATLSIRANVESQRADSQRWIGGDR
jgi:hypothetical protein